MRSVAAKVGCTAETLRQWVRQAERDRGERGGLTSEERARLKALERENREAAPGQRDPVQGERVFCGGGARPPVEAMIAFIDDHRAVHGVEPICRELPIAPSTYAEAEDLHNSGLATRHDAALGSSKSASGKPGAVQSIGRRGVGMSQDRKTRRVARTVQHYPANDLDRIIAILDRAAATSGVRGPRRWNPSRSELEQELLLVIHGLGLAHDGSEGARIIQEIKDELPSHGELAEQFEAMAQAPNPLDPNVCASDLRRRISALLRNRWLTRWQKAGRKSEPSLRTVYWEKLSASERAEVRAMARAPRPMTDNSYSAAIRRSIELDRSAAGARLRLFLRYIGSTSGTNEVPYAIKGQFIHFAKAVLGSGGRRFEVSRQALSRRWERLVTRKKRAPSPGSKAHRVGRRGTEPNCGSFTTLTRCCHL